MVLIIIALAVFARQFMAVAQRKLDTTNRANATLGKIDTALVDFVIQHRRLPCPAPATGTNKGVETFVPASQQCNPASQAGGVVPWVSLGLAESEASDAAHGHISYRVQPALVRSTPGLMDMSWCSPSGTPNRTFGTTQACTPNCSGAACMHPVNHLYSKGLQVQDGNGGWLNQPAPAMPAAPASAPMSSGAAYVLISHGPAGNPDGTLEAANRNNGTAIFYDAAYNPASGNAHFDDTLSHPTITTVLEKARLGPRVH